MELSERKCEASESMTEPLSQEEIRKMLTQTPGWEVIGNHIEKTFTFPNFVEAMRFANRIADIAEAENHHPDLHISWGKVNVELSTHKVNGLSSNDFIIAAKINRLIGTQEQQAI